MQDPPTPPAIPDAERRALVGHLRQFADGWGDPAPLRQRDPALIAERRMQARRLHAFAEAVLYGEEDIARAERPEAIALVHCLGRMTHSAVAPALATYARDFLFIERSDLVMPHGLQRAFNASR